MNERQLAVLQRIHAGDDLSGSDGITDRRSAGALADRGLLVVDRRGGRWRAKITEPGQFYLEHGHHPDDPAFTVARELLPQKRASPAVGNGQRKAANHRPPPHTTAAITAQRRAAATELVEKLVETGHLLVPKPDPGTEAELRRVIDFAKRHGLAPEGKRIEKTRMYDGRVRIRLVDGPHVNSRPMEITPVPVPDEVANLHPLLSSLTAPADVLGVSTESLPRALRIMHALLTEAQRRGHEVGWAEDTSRGIEIRIDGCVQTVTMDEEKTAQEALPTLDELAAKKMYSWQRVSPQISMVPSGKLAISVGGEGPYRTQRRWADRKRWTLEDRLGDVLSTVELQAREKEERRRDDDERTRQRQSAWEQAMTDARRQFRRDQRAALLATQVEAWELADRIRAFCQAANRSGHGDGDWLAWARAYADEIDPTTGLMTGPEDVEPGPDDLRPYLGRWSPYGPQRH
ncbi:hypothetical protein [Amycolatopsis sp. NPDC050768]|uniref:hypothetical protein n=1 Tax=Amycolatopsis sp. NPDC050768 TaxID=3154839 RepID=UPI0033E083C1